MVQLKVAASGMVSLLDANHTDLVLVWQGSDNGGDCWTDLGKITQWIEGYHGKGDRSRILSDYDKIFCSVHFD